MFWHAYPWVMDWDPRSGDFGLGYFGNALETGAYYVEDDRLGRLCFLCSCNGSTLTLEDAYRRRAFIEPVAVYLEAEAGVFARIELRLAEKRLDVAFNATEWGATPWSRLRLRVTKTSAARPGSAAVTVRRGAQPVMPVPTDNSTFAFRPDAGGGETVVTVSWV